MASALLTLPGWEVTVVNIGTSRVACGWNMVTNLIDMETWVQHPNMFDESHDMPPWTQRLIFTWRNVPAGSTEWLQLKHGYFCLLTGFRGPTISINLREIGNVFGLCFLQLCDYSHQTHTHTGKLFFWPERLCFVDLPRAAALKTPNIIPYIVLAHCKMSPKWSPLTHTMSYGAIDGMHGIATWNPSTFINTSNKMGPCLGSSPGIRRAIVLRPGALPGLRGSHGFVRNRTCLLHHKCSGSQQHFDSLKFFRDDHGLLILVGIPHQLKTDPYLDVDPKFEFVNAT